MASKVVVSHIGCIPQQQLEAVVDAMIHKNSYIRKQLDISHHGQCSSLKEYDCNVGRVCSGDEDVELLLVIKPDCLLHDYEEDDLKAGAETSFSEYKTTILNFCSLDS